MYISIYLYIYINIFFNIYIYNIYIYICIYNFYIYNIFKNNKNNLCFIKDAHRNSAPGRCLETSVRVCSGGKQSICFSRFGKYFGLFGVFVKQFVILNNVFGFVVLNSIW